VAFQANRVNPAAALWLIELEHDVPAENGDTPTISISRPSDEPGNRGDNAGGNLILSGTIRTEELRRQRRTDGTMDLDKLFGPVDLQAGDRWEAIDELINHLMAIHKIKTEHREAIAMSVVKRESSMSTGIG